MAIQRRLPGTERCSGLQSAPLPQCFHSKGTSTALGGDGTIREIPRSRSRVGADHSRVLNGTEWFGHCRAGGRQQCERRGDIRRRRALRSRLPEPRGGAADSEPSDLNRAGFRSTAIIAAICEDAFGMGDHRRSRGDRRAVSRARLFISLSPIILQRVEDCRRQP